MNLAHDNIFRVDHQQQPQSNGGLKERKMGFVGIENSFLFHNCSNHKRDWEPSGRFELKRPEARSSHPPLCVPHIRRLFVESPFFS